MNEWRLCYFLDENTRPASLLFSRPFDQDTEPKFSRWHGNGESTMPIEVVYLVA